MKILANYYSIISILIIVISSCGTSDRKVSSISTISPHNEICKKIFNVKMNRWSEGFFIFDSIPVGVHKISIQNDTVLDGIYQYKIT